MGQILSFLGNLFRALNENPAAVESANNEPLAVAVAVAPPSTESPPLPKDEDSNKDNSSNNKDDSNSNNGQKILDKDAFSAAKEETQNLVLSEYDLRKLMLSMEEKFDEGLRDEDAAVVKMLLTYVREVPHGKERGSYLALDLGGTNFRTLVVTLPGGEMKTESHAIPDKLMEGTGEQLFDHIAECLMAFIKKQGLRSGRYPLGFTFSFPCYQYGISVAKLVRWTKGFRCSGVEGENVGKLLRDALRRYQERNPYRHSSALIDVVAVINDTTGTLMSCAFHNKLCKVGLIVGTGCNVCYVETLERIDKWPGNYSDVNQVIVNTEWGAFGEGGNLDKHKTLPDMALDMESVNPTKQLYEKMISGMYLGELVRQFIKHLVDKGLLFDGQMPEALAAKKSFSTKFLSETESDETNDKLKSILTSDLKINPVTEQDMKIIRLVCERVSTRGAHLVAVGLATIIERMYSESSSKNPEKELEKVVIGYDGTVLKLHPKFLVKMTEQMKKLVGPKHTFEMVASEDGSGRGAAVVAAVAYREKRPMIVIRQVRHEGKIRKRVYEFSSYSQ